eukprot:6189661-Pleurochrysis_carterae.AAC.1
MATIEVARLWSSRVNAVMFFSGTNGAALACAATERADAPSKRRRTDARCTDALSCSGGPTHAETQRRRDAQVQSPTRRRGAGQCLFFSRSAGWSWRYGHLFPARTLE